MDLDISDISSILIIAGGILHFVEIVRNISDYIETRIDEKTANFLRETGNFLIVSGLMIAVIGIFSLTPTPTSPSTPTLMPTPTPNPIEVELDKLAPGHILFNPSKEMTLGVTEKVEIRIARNLTENLSKNLEGRGEPQFANISRLDTLMEVSLKGKNFDIDLIGGEEKVVTGEGFAEWIYYVTPLKNGFQHLALIVNVIITLPNGKEVKKETVFEETIYVKVYPIEDEIKKFESKLILFKSPEEMTIGIEETVEICIAKNITEDLFKGTAGVPQYSTIKIEQNLEGSNIDIKSPTNRKQVVPGVGLDEWVYLVTPLKSGNQSLFLIVDVIVFLPNGEEEKFTTEFKKKINIKENKSYTYNNFIKNNWKFLVNIIVTILIAIIGAITGAIGWRKYKKSKRQYLFSWDEIPGNDDNRIIEFVKDELDIEWAKREGISKIDDDKTIIVYNKDKSLSLKLNDKKTKVNLKIDNVGVYEFTVKTENGKLNIYKK